MKNLFFVCVLVSFVLACSNVTQNTVEKPVRNDQDSLKKEDPYSGINQAIKNDPNNIDLYIKRGEIAIEEGDAELAINDLERAKLIDSTDAQVWVFAGKLNYLARNLNLAKDNLQFAVKLDDGNPEAWLELAKLNYELRDLKQAFKQVNESIKRDEQQYMPYYVKGLIWLETGDTVKAVSAMQTAVELNPDFYDGFLKIGSLYDMANNDVALDYYNSAISIKPDDPAAYYYKGLYLQKTEELEEAYQTYNELLALDSTFYFAYYNQGLICYQYLDEFEIAIERFALAIERNPEYHEAIHAKGLCFEALGNMKKAEENFRKALAIKPDYDLAARSLSRIID